MNFNGFSAEKYPFTYNHLLNSGITHKISNDTQWINILPHKIVVLLWRQLRLLLYTYKYTCEPGIALLTQAENFRESYEQKILLFPYFLFCARKISKSFFSVNAGAKTRTERRKKNFCISSLFFHTLFFSNDEVCTWNERNKAVTV